ncbi:H/ACA ribonucleoprotein complex non-core subunit NAF1 [Anopheles maculipalpis]|uniref:H/ACA ribonucleoprotein complex non-core subunit NAF1 n=1 Tax=Anopheles maculipalpis TaxID=1496333 RepID=UPI0021599C8B|nr:H/ACA ribonucleoprotein complex non-core subunit NAF1 [Anopheles maculipalpis]
MEELAKSDETKNGDQVQVKETKAEVSEVSSQSSSTIATEDGGKVNLDENKQMEAKPIELTPSAADTNFPVDELSKSSTDGEKLNEKTEVECVKEASITTVKENASECTLKTDDKEPSSEIEGDEQCVRESKETSLDQAVEESKETVCEISSTVVEASAQEEPTPTMDLATEPATNQAMEIEEPVETEQVPVAIVSIQEQIATEQKLETEAVQKISNSSLSMLCQYSGSSESEAEDTDASNVAENAKVVSASSSSSDDSDVEVVKDSTMAAGGYRVRDDPILVSDAETMDTNAASSEDENDDPVKGPIRTAGEILPHELPPIEELTITVPETECKPIGHIDSIVAQIVLVQSVAGAELLNLDTVLFLERGKRALGKIFDVIGQVNQPIYCVLFNSNQEILTKNITTGMEVFCAPRTEYTSFIILSELMRTKGSDASWMHDNEIPAYLAEHSDDEEERMAKRNRKKGAANRQHPQTDGECSEMGDEPQQHQHFNPRHPSPSTSRGPYSRPPPQGGGRQFNPRYPSGTSWHHNYNPRFNQPHQPYRPRFAPRNQQQFQQIPHMQPPPQGGLYLRNPFATQGPPRPPPSGSN